MNKEEAQKLSTWLGIEEYANVSKNEKTMTQTEALKMALEALLHAYHEDEAHPKTLDAITAIKEALANVPTSDTSQERVDETAKQRHEQEAQIVRWNCPCGNEVTFRGFTQSPQRKPLSDEEILDATCHLGGWNIDVARCVINHARAIEAAHGIKE